MELSLTDCKDCDSLPALGQLPSLKFLTIRGMHQITELTEEFYGISSSKNPFNSFEKLRFAKMAEGKQWHVLGKGEFPVLQKLSIVDCPKLIGKLPENLCFLTVSRISKCPELSLETPNQLSKFKEFEFVGCPKAGVLFDDARLFTSQLEGMKQIVELVITDCNSLTSLSISILPSTLKRIRISGCRKLKLETPVSEVISNMFLEELLINKCDSIDDISPELVPRAHYLSVNSCHSLTRLLVPTGTENLDITYCKNLEILSVACGSQIRSLHIINCKKLKWQPENMQEPLPSLEDLDLQNCTKTGSFPEGGLPFNLQVLHIRYCKKLVNGCKEWRLRRLPCLRKLTIFHDSSDEEVLAGENWELPCSILRLTISNLKTLSNKLLKSLTSLEYLYTNNLPQIQSLLEQGLPSSLSKLQLYNHHDLHSLSTEGLQRLTWLRCLKIWDCPNLQSHPESGMASSLSELYISNCPNLQSLPVKVMPPSISKLSISNCPLLKPLLEFDKGDYWPKIAHIPTIDIDGEYQ